MKRALLNVRPTPVVLIAMLSVLITAAVPTPVGAIDIFGFRKPKSTKDDDEGADGDEYDSRAKVPLVGEYTQVEGGHWIQLEGAGLVVDLNSTGEDPPPSEARHAVLEDLKRRGVPNPNKILKMPNVTVVNIIGYVPALIRKGEHFDLEVRLPDGSKVKSLNGGRLMQTYLSEHRNLPGVGVKEGRQFAIGEGPIMCAVANGKGTDQTALLRRGRVVAGGTWKFDDRDLDMLLRNDFRSERNAVRLANAIGRRFFDYDRHGQRVPLAEAKTDKLIRLKVHPKYRDNYPRYLDVIRKIAFRETEVARSVRVRSLKWDLLDPETSAQAALKLEAIGDSTIPMLKTGLKSKDPQVRFHSAEALAYLGDNSGLDALFEAARDQYAFRIFALAAMACLDDPEVHVKLRELMDSESAETRYGAFRALTTLDKNDPFVRGESMNEKFRLHTLQTDGPSMAHITNCKKAEVVLFGADQKLRLPLFARAGNNLIVSGSASDGRIEVCRFEVGREDRRKTVSPRLSEVIRALSEFDATFPDVAQFLSEADGQRNLAGRLEIDALPKAGRTYLPPVDTIADKSKPKRKSTVGNAINGPNMFAINESKPIEKKKGAKTEIEDSDKPETAAADRTRRTRSDLDTDDDRPLKTAGKKSSSQIKQVSADDDTPPSKGGALKTAVQQSDPDADDKAPADKSATEKNSTDKNSTDKSPTDKSSVDKEAADAKASAATPAAPPPSRFSFWKLFRFGGGDVSGNQEPQ